MRASIRGSLNVRDGSAVTVGAGRLNLEDRFVKLINGFLLLNIGRGKARVAGACSWQSCIDICIVLNYGRIEA